MSPLSRVGCLAYDCRVQLATACTASLHLAAPPPHCVQRTEELLYLTHWIVAHPPSSFGVGLRPLSFVLPSPLRRHPSLVGRIPSTFITPPLAPPHDLRTCLWAFVHFWHSPAVVSSHPRSWQSRRRRAPSCRREPRSPPLPSTVSIRATPPFTMAEFDLDPSQQQAWELFVSGKNVGLFGRAGSGKSTVLGRAIARARRVHGVANVGVMAWTTTAAKIIDGCTFHKFLSIKVEERPKEVILQNVLGKKFVRDKVRKTKVIFIDEVPQFAARWFTVFEYVVRQLAPPYKQALPWGGVQVVGTS